VTHRPLTTSATPSLPPESSSKAFLICFEAASAIINSTSFSLSKRIHPTTSQAGGSSLNTNDLGSLLIVRMERVMPRVSKKNNAVLRMKQGAFEQFKGAHQQSSICADHGDHTMALEGFCIPSSYEQRMCRLARRFLRGLSTHKTGDKTTR